MNGAGAVADLIDSLNETELRARADDAGLRIPGTSANGGSLDALHMLTGAAIPSIRDTDFVRFVRANLPKARTAATARTAKDALKALGLIPRRVEQHADHQQSHDGAATRGDPLHRAASSPRGAWPPSTWQPLSASGRSSLLRHVWQTTGRFRPCSRTDRRHARLRHRPSKAPSHRSTRLRRNAARRATDGARTCLASPVCPIRALRSGQQRSSRGRSRPRHGNLVPRQRRSARCSARKRRRFPS